MERAYLCLYDEKEELCGVGGPHVDDSICCGKGRVFEESIEALRKEVKWGSWKADEFVHCGREISTEPKTRDVR